MFIRSVLFAATLLSATAAQACVDLGRTCEELTADTITLQLSPDRPNFDVLKDFTNLKSVTTHLALNYDATVDLAALRKHKGLSLIHI